MAAKLTPAAEETLLKEIRTRFDYAYDQWHDIREEGKTDMRFVAGDPWDPKDRAARETAGRFCLSLDELGQYFNQVINDVRSNPRGLKFAPVGDGANDDTARFYGDKAREIEYRSRASIVYTTAFENAVQRGYGFMRVNTRYASDRSMNQDLWLEPIVNPDSVLLDPDAISPDSSDMKYGFVFESRTEDEFKHEFPRAKITDFTNALSLEAPKWIQAGHVQIAEYWTVKSEEKTLYLLAPPPAPAQPGLGLRPDPPPQEPIGVFADELDDEPDPAEILGTRTVTVKSVVQYLTNGVEILKTTEWPGKYIPIISCYGKVLYADMGSGTERKLLSMTRLARDPYMAYCFYRTCEMENVGMTTKNPYWAYEGQLSPAQLVEIQKSLHEPVAVLLAKATTEATGQTVLPLPVKNVSEVQIQGLSVGAEEMRRAIQAAMGSSPLPTQAQRRNEKSGIALRQIESSAQKGSFHFVDHYNDMIQHAGVILENLMDKIYDTDREVGIRKANDTAEIVRVNDGKVSTKGTHQVTVSTGPSFDSEREQASDFVDALIGSATVPQIVGPEKAQKLLALGIKLKNIGPIGDEMVEVIDPSTEMGEMTPEQAQAQLGQVTAKLKQLEQVAQQMKQALDTDQAKQQATVQKAQVDADAKQQQATLDAKAAIVMAREKNATTIAVAHIQAASKGLALDAHAAEEAQALGHEAEQAEQDRGHEAALTALEQQHDRELAEMGQAHALEAGQATHQNTLDQMAAEPRPEAGA